MPYEKKPQPKDYQDFHEEYLNSASAKIKNIYIELPDYEYFHSPSGVSRKDKRFIGREKVRKKLRTILSHSFSKAGAYLVTGYRGMGKTSMVRSVIADLKEGNEPFEDGKIQSNKKSPLRNWRMFWHWLWLSLAAVALAYIAWAVPLRTWELPLLDRFLPPFNETVPWITILIWVLEGLVLALLACIGLLAGFAKKNRYKSTPSNFLLLIPQTSKRKEFYYRWWIWVIKGAKNQQLLEVETSLSQDNIKDLDFLRLLAKNIQKVFNDFCKPLYSYHKAIRFSTQMLNVVTAYFIFLSFIEHYFYANLPQTGPPFQGIFDLRYYPLFILISIGAYLVLFVLSKRVFFKILEKIGFITQFEIKRKLRSLITKIDARTTLDKGKSFSPNFSRYSLFQVGRNQRLEYPIASTKEIEFSLIEILDDIDRTRLPAHVPKLICVFDELDKIQLNVNQDLDHEKMAIIDRDYISRRLRERRERISNVLANLKHFLNVAKAKFVFIAGREMFDASLADVSDRDFFLGSIFHEIIYVDSFLKDQLGTKAYGLTNMTEKYICQFLLAKTPANLNSCGFEKLNLKEYYDLIFNYLDLTHPKDIKENQPLVQSYREATKKSGSYLSKVAKIHAQEALNAEELQKTISVLQNLIIYLVYRSNGTPKKLTNLFESFIQELTIDYKGDGGYTIRGKSPLTSSIIWHPATDSQKKSQTQKTSFFLCFDFNDQYLLGLTSYLFRPYLISSSQYTKFFGDKLLFSTSFLVDHFFKFHSWAFSWKTLEMTPELVFASKSPELRTFIGNLLGSFLRSHIREVVYGVFEYRFYNKTRHEVAYISKIREEESAAYNFTLDESMHIKLHFQRRIKKLFKEYGDHPARLKEDYYQSLSFLYSTLGDIFFYDQEFDEAILAYSEAVAIYSRQQKEGFTPHQLTNWMKDRLKMGLTYERMHSQNEALSVYEGLLGALDDMLANKPNPYTSSPKFDHGFAKTLFENLRFFQLPFLAKLVLIEKEGISGITYFDLLHNEKRMRRILKNCLQHSPKTNSKNQAETQEFLIRTYYHLNLGSILYFKNGTVLHGKDELDNDFESITTFLTKVLLRRTTRKYPQNFPISASIEYYKAFLYLNGRLCAFSEERVTAVQNNTIDSIKKLNHSSIEWLINRLSKNIEEIDAAIQKKSNQSATLSYRKVLFERIKDNLNKNSPIYFIFASSLWFLYLFPYETRFINKDKNLLSTLSLILSKFGDLLLSYVTTQTDFNLKKWQYLFDVKNVLEGNQPRSPGFFVKGSFSPIDLHKNPEDLVYYASFFYLLSSMYYKQTGLHQNHEFQLRKLLYLIKDYLSFGLGQSEITIEDAQEFCNMIRIDIINPSLKSITDANKTTNRPQIFKYKDLFAYHESTSPYQSKMIYNLISNSPETRETVLLMAEIELKFFQYFKGQNGQILSFHLIKNFINPNSHYPTKFVRMHELLFKAQCNFSILFEIQNFVTERLYPEQTTGNLFQDPQIIEDAAKLAKVILVQFVKKGFEKSITEKDNNPEQDPRILEILKHFLPEYQGKIDSTKKEKPNIPKERHPVFESLLCESLFCLIDVIKTLEIFGINYMTNLTYRGFTHAKLGDWCLLYQAYLQFLPKEDQRLRFKEQLQKITETANINYLEPRYHYELATNYLYSCLEMHNSGKAYFQQLEQMYFLEDDFNDNMYHFSAALERYKINIGAIPKKIEWLKLYKNLSKTLQYESYINKDDYFSN